jgi:amino acid permease
MKNWDNIWIGMLIGLLGFTIGFLCFGLGFSLWSDITLRQFVEYVFLGLYDFESRIITVAILFDVAIFYWFMRKNMLQLCKGIMAIMVLSVPLVAWLY